MSTSRTASRRQRAANAESSTSINPIPERWRDLAACLVILLSVYLFLFPATFGGGHFNASDNVASASFETYLSDAAAKGEFPEWMPYIFSGMPSYAALLTTGERWWDFIANVAYDTPKILRSFFGTDAARVALFYAIYGIGVYWLMRSKKFMRYQAMFAAFGVMFSTFVIAWVMIGHNTKPAAMMAVPYVLIALERLRKQFSLTWAAVTVIAVHVMLESTHVQMAFYAICAFGLWFLTELVVNLVKKQPVAGVLRATAILAVAGGLSFAMASDRLLSVMEYTEYSTRGTAPIVKTDGAAIGEQGGYDYDYATNWSFSPSEVLTFFVPNWYGFGKLEYSGPLTGGKPTTLMAYFGQMPFTDAANYMGIIVLALALVGAVRYKNSTFVIFLIVVSVFSLFLSFGKNMPLLYDIFFYSVPGFNKFRAPSMALALLQLAVPILAAYGLRAVEEWREQATDKQKRNALLFAGSGAVFLVAGLVYPGMAEASYMGDLAANATTSRYPQELQQWIFEQWKSDWMVTAALLLAGGAMVWAYVNRKVNAGIFAVAIVSLSVLDLWRVGTRPMEVEKESLSQTSLSKTETVSFLKEDKELYRIADFGFPAPNIAAYHKIQTIHGYHSAKLRSYQDILDVAGKGGGSTIANPFLWNLLNVKYIVGPADMFGPQARPIFASQSERIAVFANADMLPRAFFVAKAEVAKPMQILEHLRDGDFNPRETAYTEEPIAAAFTAPSSSATATVKEFANEKLVIETRTEGDNLMFVSEMYYPYWKAYVDGKPAQTYKLNYAFRGVIVPAGTHTVEMRYESTAMATGKMLSLGGNILTLALLAVGLVLDRRKPGASPEIADSGADEEEGDKE